MGESGSRVESSQVQLRPKYGKIQCQSGTVFSTLCVFFLFLLLGDNQF